MTLRSRLLLSFLLLTAGCTPSIGDKCLLSTDCSLRGDRLCDTSQPNGYCTVFNCQPDTCPNSAACTLFHANLPGCPIDDRTPSRDGRTFCMAQCHSDSDCRVDDGYICADPRQPPWNALILDDDQTQRVCIQRPVAASFQDAGTDIPPVCAASGPPVPDIDASHPEEDAGGVDAGAGIDGGVDAGIDAGEAGAGDAGIADAATEGG